MLESNKAVIRRDCDETWNKGMLSVVDETYDPAYVRHDTGDPEFKGGIEAYKQLVRTTLAAFPDFHLVIEDMVAEGDRVVTRYLMSGTQKGDYMGIPASGKRFQIEGIGIARMKAGKVVEEWMVYDTLGLMQQLGVIPTGEKPAK